MHTTARINALLRAIRANPQERSFLKLLLRAEINNWNKLHFTTDGK
jgi:hypothetical protein